MNERTTPIVSVIVPARDAAATLPRTLDGLARQNLIGSFEVVVVDNGSNDDTAAIAERHPLAPRVIRRERGEGPGAARNDGVAASTAPILAFVDSDCEPDPSWLSEGVAALSDGVDLLAGTVRPPVGESVGPFDRTLWVSREHGLYETANLFVRREWFDRLGGFQDLVLELPGLRGSAGRPFGEDVWFAWRARRDGARTGFESRAVVYHVVFPGTPRDFVVENWRLRYFPALVSRVPELRRTFAWKRVFLSPRTAAFDAAIAGVLVAVFSGSMLALPAAAPYAARLASDLRRWGKKRAVVSVLRDAVGFAALTSGSVQARSLLL